MPPRVLARTAGALLERNDAQLVGHCGLRLAEFLRGARGGLVESQASFHADNQQVEDVGQAQLDLLLPPGNLFSQPEIGREIAYAERCRVHDERALVSEAGEGYS